jgi:hypothetical protein
MFSELLSCAMDRERAHEAHPAFPMIIRQISSDEAKILKSLYTRDYSYVWTRDFDSKIKIFVGKPTVEIDDLSRTELFYPDNVPFYREHLHQLGLTGVFQEGNQEILFGAEPKTQTGVRARNKFRLTDFGRRFVHACTSNEGQSSNMEG